MPPVPLQLDAFGWDGPQEGTGKEIPASVKGEEEIAALTVDERLGDVERAVYLLNNGQAVQQKHTIVSLPTLVRVNGRGAFKEVLPALKAALPKLDLEAQVLVADSFSTLLQEKLLGSAEISEHILPWAIRSLAKEKTEDETSAWAHVMLDMIPLLDGKSLRVDVTACALSKCEGNTTTSSRVLASQLFGKLARHLASDEFERQIFQRAVAMCQDTEWQVRVSMASQLPFIAKAMAKEKTRISLLDEVSELLADEFQQVRLAAFPAFVAMLEYLPLEARRSTAMPIMRRHMHPLELTIDMQRCIASLFPAIINELRDLMTDDADTQLFYGCFKHLATRPDTELRRACAAQLAAVLKNSKAPEAVFTTYLADVLYQVAADSEDSEARRLVASTLHEVAASAGKKALPAALLRPLISLLRDIDTHVAGALLANLPAVLRATLAGATDDPRSSGSASAQIASALVSLEAAVGRSWRVQHALMTAFAQFPTIFDADTINEQFLPIAYKLATDAAAAVQTPAAEAVVIFFRNTRNERKRADIFMRIVREFARSRSCVHRYVFAEMCYQFEKKCSARFVKEYVLDLCLELFKDPVPNVRLKLVGILPALKKTIKLPEDVDQLEKLNGMVTTLMTDVDRDVSQAARVVHEVYKRTALRMGGGSMYGGEAAAAAASRRESGGGGGEQFSDRQNDESFGFLPDDAERIRNEVAMGQGRGARSGLAGRGPRPEEGAAGGAAVQNPGTHLLRNSKKLLAAVSSAQAASRTTGPTGSRNSPDSSDSGFGGSGTTMRKSWDPQNAAAAVSKTVPARATAAAPVARAGGSAASDPSRPGAIKPPSLGLALGASAARFAPTAGGSGGLERLSPKHPATNLGAFPSAATAALATTSGPSSRVGGSSSTSAAASSAAAARPRPTPTTSTARKPAR